jgi:ABC-2 type transport system permease protein
LTARASAGYCQTSSREVGGSSRAVSRRLAERAKMQALRAVIRKEFIHIRRDPRLIGYVVVLPVIILLLFGFALHLKVDNLRVAVCDQDKTFFSFEVKNRLQLDSGLYLIEVDTPEAVQELIRTGRAHLGLEIPAGFSRRVADNEQTTFELLVDGTMPTIAQAGLYGASVLTDEETAQKLSLDDPDHPSAPVRKHPIKLNQTVLFNPHLRDSDFFLPGTMGIVMMLVSLALATGIVREKEAQTIEQLWATPISRSALVAGKMLPCAIVTVLDFAVALALSYWVFGLPLRGSLPAILALAAFFILSVLALGTFISVISNNELQAHFLSVFVFVVSILMSGFIFPIEAMPRWLQPTAASLPMTYFLDGIRRLTLKGVPATAMFGDFAALGCFTLLLVGLCMIGLKKQAS